MASTPPDSASATSRRHALLVLAAVAALLVGLLAAAFWSTPKSASVQSGTLLKNPRPLPEFTLTDQDGEPFTREQLRGHWTLIFPGFTYCPDICPTTLGMLKVVESQLGAKADGLQVMLFSIDPQRDTPEAMKRYVQYFSPRFTGATVAEPELKRVAQALGVAYLKVPGESDESYTMDHSAALILINPRAEIAGYFTPPHQADALARDLAAVMESSR